MADLPSDVALGGLQTASGERQVASVDTSAIGQGVARFGQGVDQLSNGVATYTRTLTAQNDAVQELKATSQFLTAKVGLDEERDNLDDPAELTAHAAKYQTALQSAAQNISNPAAQQKFLLNYTPTVASSGVAVRDRIDTLADDQARADFVTSIPKITAAAAKSQDPAVIGKGLDAINASIQKMVDDGHMTELDAANLRKQAGDNYLVSVHNGITDPNDRLNTLRVAPATKDGILNRIGGVEDASGDPNIKNPKSSATGQFQFINDTWLGLVKSYRPDLADKSKADILALRADPALQREMAGHYFDEIAGYFQSRGIQPTAANMRLGWFLGQGDAARVLKADPSTPIADVVNGQSIAANPTILPGRTAGSVIAWATKQMGGTAPGGSIFTQSLPADKVADLRNQAARAAMQQDDAAAQQTRDEIATVQSLVKDDQASLISTGKPLDSLTPERVGMALGSQAQADFLASREMGQKVYDTTNQWPTLPNEAIMQKVESLRPVAGSDRFDMQQKYFEAAQKAAASVVKQREDDPAGVVDTLPAVKTAKQAVDPQKPDSFVPVVKARMTAQDAIGIKAPSPMTKTEVDGFTSQMMPLTRGQANVYAQNSLIDKVIGQVKAQYGPYAPQAMTQILANISLSPEASYAVSAAVQKLAPQAAPAPTDAALAPPPSVAPDRWQKILDKRPLAADGNPMPAGEWATFMHRLAANPTPEEVAMFNASRFGKAGFDGNDILKQLAGQ